MDENFKLKKAIFNIKKEKKKKTMTIYACNPDFNHRQISLVEKNLRIAHITIVSETLETKKYKPCTFPLVNPYPFNIV